MLRHRLAPNNPDVIATFAQGAVSVAGLAPTLISTLTASFAILHDLPPAKQFWWLYGILVVVIVIGLIMGREVFSRNLYDMSISRIVIFGRPWITYTMLHSVYNYVINLLLIGLCALLW